MKQVLAVLVVAGAVTAAYAGGMCGDASKGSCAATISDAKAAQPAKAQDLCPVSGDKVDKKVYTDYEGKRIYFCCAKCVDAFKKNPAKYLKDMSDAGVTLETVPAPAGK